MTTAPPLPLAGEQPFSFTTALRPHFACDDLSQRPEFVRILGLGGKWTYDYENPYHPKLGMEGEDYVYFAGKPRNPGDHTASAERAVDHILTKSQVVSQRAGYVWCEAFT